jgi:hypothetical protein
VDLKKIKVDKPKEVKLDEPVIDRAIEEVKPKKMNFSNKLKELLMPQEDENVAFTMDGNLAVNVDGAYRTINADREIVEYPAELVFKLPVFTIPKQAKNLKKGDIIVQGKSYYLIEDFKNGKIMAVNFNGNGHSITPVKDFLLGQTMARVVISLVNLNNGFNPMMFMLMDKKEDLKDMLLPMMFMNGGNMGGMNPMMALMMLSDKEGKNSDSLKDIMLMMAFQQNGGMNIFGPQVAPATVKATKCTKKGKVETDEPTEAPEA